MMGIYSQLLDFAKLASKFFNFRRNRNVNFEPPKTGASHAKGRRGKWSNAVAKRRRLNELAKQSRRINWQVAKGIAIRG